MGRLNRRTPLLEKTALLVSALAPFLVETAGAQAVSQVEDSRAQDSRDQDSQVEQPRDTILAEIVVTAQKREQSVRDVGITMSVLSGEELRNAGVNLIQDVPQNIANVQVNYGFGQNAFNIRGIGVNEFSANLDSPVAVHLDEVYLSKNFMTNLLLFDIERVEALKGPQGTLFGRNTTGGSMNFYTRRPTDSFEGGVTLGYDNYETMRGEGFLSGPLGGSFAARLSGFAEDQGEGYYRNLVRGEDEGKTRRSAVRGQLAWENGTSNALLSVHYGRDQSELGPYEGMGIFTPASVAAGTFIPCAEYLAGTVTGDNPDCVRASDGRNPGDTDPYTSTNELSHETDNSSIGGALRFEHDLGWANLTSISAFERFRRDARDDSDGSPTQNIDVYYYQKFHQYSQELRLTSGADPTWNYVVGAYYEHDKLRDSDYAPFFDAAFGVFTDFTQQVDAAALYFHNEVALSEPVKIIAGARYTWEKTQIDGGTVLGAGFSTASIAERPALIIAPLADSQAIAGGPSEKVENVSFKLGLQWEPLDVLDDLMIYAHVSTGFRSGGFNALFATSQAAFTRTDPEYITAYEAGFKSLLAAGAMQLNGSVFNYDFRDGVINIDSPTSIAPVSLNAANIRITGVETDLRWQPTQGLDISGGAGWLHARVRSDITSSGASLKGNHPINSPEWTLNSQVRYEAPLASGLGLAFRANANWRSSQFLEAINAPSNREEPYWLVNADITLLKNDGAWSLSIWGKNLTQSVYRSFVNDLPATNLGYTINIYGPPRTYGVSGSVRF